MSDEFWKCWMSADLPWIRAYEMVHTFSLLNFSHLRLLNS